MTYEDPTRTASILERIVQLRADIARLDASWNEHPELRHEFLDLEIRCFELFNQYLPSILVRLPLLLFYNVEELQVPPRRVIEHLRTLSDLNVRPVLITLNGVITGDPDEADILGEITLSSLFLMIRNVPNDDFVFRSLSKAKFGSLDICLRDGEEENSLFFDRLKDFVAKKRVEKLVYRYRSLRSLLQLVEMLFSNNSGVKHLV